MIQLLTDKEISILSRLEEDLITAYRDASTTPENRADAEIIRRGIRDRLKPYEIQSVLVGGIIQKVITTVKTQQALIKTLMVAFDGRESGEVTMQMLNDVGVNPFAVQLLCESFSKLERNVPIKFKFNDIVFILGANFETSLSTDPSDLLEQERTREAVIQAAKQWYYNVCKESNEGLINACENLENSLEALEGGK